MPQLDPNIVAGLDDQEQRTNFIVELLTPTPRRWTNYRGYASNGQRGIIVAGLYYRAAHVIVPQIDEDEGVAPVEVDLIIGNADNLSTELVSDSANLAKVITITKLHFHDATWSEAIPPTLVRTQPWFEGKSGMPSFEGELVKLHCHADMGRRGSSPKTDSRALMINHAPLPPGHRLTFNIWRS
jgi:hypothetical protein